MSGTTSQTATTYCQPQDVFHYLRYYSSVLPTVSAGAIVGSEAVGTGNASTTIFALANQRVIEGTDKVYLAGVLTTAYTIDEDNGILTFNAAPGNGVAITAAYEFTNDITTSSVVKFILRAQDEIDRRIGRTFQPFTTTTEMYDGNSNDFTNVFNYEPQRFIDVASFFMPNQESLLTDRFLQLRNFPVASLGLVALNEQIDQRNDEIHYTTDLTFGSTTYLAQKFDCGLSLPLDRVSLYLKYNTGTPAAITVEIHNDSSGSPGTLIASASATISALSTTQTSYAMFDAFFLTPPFLTGGTNYWIVVYSSGASATNTYKWGANNSTPVTYAAGFSASSTNSGTSYAVSTTSAAIFNTYACDQVANYADYRIDKDTGRLVLITNPQTAQFVSNAQTNMNSVYNLFIKGIQNVVVNYSFGYATIPPVVEDLCVKLASLYTIEAAILGSPVPQEVTRMNADRIKREVDFALQSLGERLAALVV